MPDEQKQAGKGIKVFLKVILGVILILVGGFLIWKWFGSLLLMIKGCLGIFLVLAGLITLAIAKE